MGETIPLMMEASDQDEEVPLATTAAVERVSPANIMEGGVEEPSPNEEQMEDVIFKTEPEEVSSDWSNLEDDIDLDTVVKKEEAEEGCEEDYSVQVNSDAVVKVESQCPDALKQYSEAEITAAFAACIGHPRYRCLTPTAKGGTLFTGVLRRLSGDLKGFGLKERLYLYNLWKAKYQFQFPNHRNEMHERVSKTAKSKRRKVQRLYVSQEKRDSWKENAQNYFFQKKALEFLSTYPETLEHPPPCTAEELERVREREFTRKAEYQRDKERHQLNVTEPLSPEDPPVVKSEPREDEHDIPVNILEISEMEQTQGKYLEVRLPRVTESELLALRCAPKWNEAPVHKEISDDPVDEDGDLSPISEEEAEIPPPRPRKTIRHWTTAENEKAQELEWTQLQVLGVIPQNPPENECSICGKTLSTKNLLTLHLQTHFSFEEHLHFLRQVVGPKKLSNSQKLEPELTSSRQPPQKKRRRQGKPGMKQNEKRNGFYGPVICPQCGKQFSTIYTLQGHERLHHSEEPPPHHPCLICGRPFLKRNDQQMHMPTHLGRGEVEQFVMWRGGIDEFLERLNNGEDLSKPPTRGRGPRAKTDFRERRYLVRRPRGRPRKNLQNSWETPTSDASSLHLENAEHSSNFQHLHNT